MKRKITLLLVSLFLMVGTALAQKNVSGTVISSDDGQPIIGAAVKALGASVGTQTDIDGSSLLNYLQVKQRLLFHTLVWLAKLWLVVLV